MATVVKALPDYPFFVQAASGDADIYYDAEDFRRFTRSIVPTSGVLTSTALRVSQGDVVGWRVKVNAGSCVVQGQYIAHNPEEVTLELSGFNFNLTSARTHRIYVCIYDKLVSGSEYAAKIVAVEDPGGGASPPSDATYSQLIAFATVNPGQSSIQQANITDLRTHARMGSSWQSLAVLDGVADASDDIGTKPFGYYYSASRIYFTGAVMRTGTAPFQALTAVNIASMPYWVKPKYQKYLPAVSSLDSLSSSGTNSSFTARCAIDKNGLVTVVTGYQNNPKYIILDGLSFDLDN